MAAIAELAWFPANDRISLPNPASAKIVDFANLEPIINAVV